MTLAALATIAIRLPLLGVPLDADEGGYAYLSRRWADGNRLYGPAWVDRPQALLVSYRLVTALGRSRMWIHLAAIGLAVLLMFAVASAGWALAGRRAALLGAVLVAIAGAAPHLQGFMFNGELAAGAFSAWAVAGAAWYARRRAGWLLVLAGGCGAIALLMKQSGFDGLAVALVCAVVIGRFRAVALVLLGAAGPLGLALLQAALTSWRDWWFAVVGYRLQTSAGSRGGLSGRWHNLTAGLPHLWPDLLPLGVLGLAGLAVCLIPRGSKWLGTESRHPNREHPNRGHPNHRHPNRTHRAGWHRAGWCWRLPGSSAGCSSFRTTGCSWSARSACWVRWRWRCCRRGRRSACWCLPACPACSGPPAPAWPRRTGGIGWRCRTRGCWPTGRSRPGCASTPRRADQLYAFVSSADLYYTTGLHTDFRYLWQANLEAIPSALGELRSYLAGADRPQWVVLYQQPAAIDPSGALAETLAGDYRPVTVIEGYTILHAR